MSEPSIPMIPDEIKALIDEQNAKLTPNTLTVRSKTTPLSTSQTRTPAHRGVRSVKVWDSHPRPRPNRPCPSRGHGQLVCDPPQPLTNRAYSALLYK
jgi:hypothetical protein